jgi:heme oxygenase
MIEMEDIPITKDEYIAMAKTINQLRKEKQHLIDKACEWLQYNFKMPNDFEYHLRKAMEEQQ